MVGEAIRRMLATETDINFHYCSDPTKAIGMAKEICPTVILQDLVMPEIDGLTLLKFFRVNPSTHDTPMIVLSTKEEPKIKAEAFGLGANDYLVKLPDRIELIARIRHHSDSYIRLLQRNEAYQALYESQKVLAAELAEAAGYVLSQLPEPLDGEIKTEWKFISSMQLGGDSFGYHWLDSENFVMFLLDVCGHGVGAALLSVSVMNALREHTLPNTDFRDPAQVLAALNDAFQMETHNNMYFTIWYGVYNKTERRISYASGGHPPAILLTGETPQSVQVKQLATKNMVIGGLPDVSFKNDSCQLGAFNKLSIFSDGIFEITKDDGTIWDFNEFVDYVAEPSECGRFDTERIIRHARALGGKDAFDDDASLLQVIL
jgi:sigma-B regulation protein RsbU (phosphoserine phosphatase)